MAIKGKISNVRFTDVHTVLSAPADSDLEFEFTDNTLTRVHTVFDFHDRSKYQALGLSSDADGQEIKHLLAKLIEAKGAPFETKQKIVSASRVMLWVTAGNTLASVTEKLLKVIDGSV